MAPTRPFPVSLLPVGALLLGLLHACGGERDDAASSIVAADPGRDAFEAVALPDGETAGADPQALVHALYASSEPVEGHYSEEAVTLSDTGGAQVVLFTQLGLPDDSVRGTRYRLELLQQSGQWQVIWAGRQVSCWPGRGHEDWGTEPCV